MKVVDYCPCCGSNEIRKTYGFLAPFLTKRIFGWERVQLRAGDTTAPLLALSGIIICEQCAFACSDIRFDEEELARLYHEYRGPAYTTLRMQYEPEYARIAKQIGGPIEIESRKRHLDELLHRTIGDELANVRTVLDYGGDEGQFIPSAFPAAVARVVYDISGKRVRAGVSRLAELADARGIDFVMVCHVLEHMPYPRRVLDDVRQISVPKAWVYAEMPLEVADRAVLRDEDVSGRPVHEHINFFNSHSARALFETSGFAIKHLSVSSVYLGWCTAPVISLVARRV